MILLAPAAGCRCSSALPIRWMPCIVRACSSSSLQASNLRHRHGASAQPKCCTDPTHSSFPDRLLLESITFVALEAMSISATSLKGYSRCILRLNFEAVSIGATRLK